MAFDVATPCWMPDVPYTQAEEWRLNIAQFGDGYQQRALDGINALKRTWSLTWTNREVAVVNAIIAYLGNVKAAAFNYYDPATGLTWKVFCDAWSVSWGVRRPGGIYYGTITAEFVKANGAAIT